MKADLVLLKKDGAHKAFPLTSSVIVIGRRHDCDLQIPLPTVSRRHCQISLNGETLKIRDLGSKAGTFVNEKRLDGDKEGSLKPGDHLRIGPLVFICQIDGKPEKITSPKESAPIKPKPEPKEEAPVGDLDAEFDDAVAEKSGDALDDSFADLDASGGFIGLDEDEGAKEGKSK